jgi:hypothetical protein
MTCVAQQVSLSSPGQGRWIGEACGTNGDKRIAHTVFMGKAKGKRPLGRPSH